MRYSFFFFSTESKKREWEGMIYTVSLAAVWWGEKKCITLGVAPPGRQMNKIERGDIANKGDIVCDADDSQEAEEPLSACDTSSLKPSPALPFSDLFCSPSTPLSSLSHFFSTLVPAERPGYLSLSPFSLPHLIPVWKLYLSPSLISLQSTESQTLPCHPIRS